MLAEIRCSSFADCGTERPPVILNESLNVILGSSGGSNSIGKSTFLLIVDFAFGGKQYSSCKDVIENVGPHSIDFCFKFAGSEYHFSRSPVDAAKVWRCDAAYSRIGAITLSEFCDWLSDMYGMTELGGSFRGLVGNFIRVYGKGNHDESKPLSAHPQERQSDGITRVLRLFGKYSAVDATQAALDEAEKDKKTFLESLRRNFIASAKTKSEAKANDKRIADLQAELEELEATEHDNLNELDPLIAEQVAEAKSKLSSLRRARTRFQSQLKIIEADEECGAFKKTRGFDKLLEFFPNADVKRIEEIESFHAGLLKALAAERKKERDSIEKSIVEIDTEIAVVQEEVKSAGRASNLTKAVLQRYSALSRDIEKLRDANQSFEKKEVLSQTVRILKSQRDALISAAMSETQSSVNERLLELNEYVCGPGQSIPRLSLEKPDSYSFSIANDSGTGSQSRAMALFDLALLELTPLPVIALDNVSSKHICDEHMLRMLELYKRAGKQVFLTFDKAESYGNGSIPETVGSSVVLELSEGHELFGRSWAKSED